MDESRFRIPQFRKTRNAQLCKTCLDDDIPRCSFWDGNTEYDILYRDICPCSCDVFVVCMSIPNKVGGFMAWDNQIQLNQG